MRRIYTLFALLCVFALLSSCAPNPIDTTSSTVNPPVSTDLAPNTEQGGYPGPVDNRQQTGYPEPNTINLTTLSTLPPGELPSAPKEAPLATPGNSSISGVVFSFTSRIILPDTIFYLTPSIGKENALFPLLTGPDTATGDIQGRTNMDGYITLADVPPGDYYLIVWAPYSWTPVVDTSTDAYTPILFTFEADQSYPLGVLQVSWP